MKREIVVLGAGKIGRGSVALFFTQAGWKVDLYGHTMSKMRQLEEQGYYETMNELGERTRVEGFEILDCTTDDELVERLAQVNVCAVAAYAGAFSSMAVSVGKAIQRRADEGNDEPLNVMLCVNDVNCHLVFDEGIRSQLDERGVACYEKNVGLCYGMVMSLGSNPPEGENPWLVLTSSHPLITVDMDPWKGERPEIPHIAWTTNGLGQIYRKVFCGNMSHALYAYVGHAKGTAYMDEGILDNEWSNWLNYAAFEEALFALTHEFEFDPAEIEEFRRHQQEANTPSHDPFTRIGNTPARKLSYNERFIWPARKCLEHGMLPYFLACGTAYGLIWYCDLEGVARPTCKDEVVELVERICGLTADGNDKLLRDLIVCSYLRIPEAGFAPADK